MQKRHTDRELYFREQIYTTQTYVIPYISRFVAITPQTRVLEIGCGEGGNLTPFLDKGCECVGVDLMEWKIELGNKIFSDHPNHEKVKLIYEDIYNLTSQDIGLFDLVFLRDTIEHIPNQRRFMGVLKQFLKPEGRIFFAFPPWPMPFGGHQQTCRTRLASSIPFYHLLPVSLYTGMLKWFGENPRTIEGLKQIKETGIWIEQFKRYARESGYRVVYETCYFINPNYQIKFGLKPRKLFLLDKIPYIRDFFTTVYYCMLSVENG